MIFSNEILLLCSMYIILKSELYNSLSSNKDLTTFSFFFFSQCLLCHVANLVGLVCNCSVPVVLYKCVM